MKSFWWRPSSRTSDPLLLPIKVLVVRVQAEGWAVPALMNSLTSTRVCLSSSVALRCADAAAVTGAWVLQTVFFCWVLLSETGAFLKSASPASTQSVTVATVCLLMLNKQSVWALGESKELVQTQTCQASFITASINQPPSPKKI